MFMFSFVLYLVENMLLFIYLKKLSVKFLVVIIEIVLSYIYV